MNVLGFKKHSRVLRRYLPATTAATKMDGRKDNYTTERCRRTSGYGLTGFKLHHPLVDTSLLHMTRLG